MTDDSTLPNAEESEAFIRTLQLVTIAMNKQCSAMLDGRGSKGMHDVAVETTNEIMRLFQ